MIFSLCRRELGDGQITVTTGLDFLLVTANTMQKAVAAMTVLTIVRPNNATMTKMYTLAESLPGNVPSDGFGVV